MNYYIGDTMFGNPNIIEQDNRPFSTLEEQDYILIQNINSISRHDDLYILGNFSCYGVKKTLDILTMIRCENLHLITGIRDIPLLESDRFKDRFIEISPYIVVNEKNKAQKIFDVTKIILSHYPFYTWENKNKGAYHFHSHIRDVVESDEMQINGSYNVSCTMPWVDYKPKSFSQIILKDEGIYF